MFSFHILTNIVIIFDYNKVVIRLSVVNVEFCFVHNVRNIEVLKLFAFNLKRLRVMKGFTQEYLAEEANISQVQVARMEKGKLNTSISNLFVLSKALNCSFDEFFKEIKI